LLVSAGGIFCIYMDELEISGKRYISTRLAAKEHKYHADYIGQLIRGKKILGQKVGRSWYVEEKSLAEYFGKEAPMHLEEPMVVGKTPEPEAQEAAVEETPVAIPSTPAQETARASMMSAEVIVAAAKILEAAKIVAVAQTPKAEEVPEVVEIQTVEEEKVAEEAEEKEESSIESEQSNVRDLIHIPVRIARPSFVALRNKAGLRYIDDDAAALPEVKKTKARKPAAVRIETPAGPEEVYITEYAAKEGSSGILVPAISIAVLGVVAFAVVALSSVVVNSNLLIEAGKTASVWYSLQ